MFIAQFFKASSLKKIRSITFIVWVPGRVEKNAKKGKKNDTCFYTHFSRALSTMVTLLCAKQINTIFKKWFKWEKKLKKFTMSNSTH